MRFPNRRETETIEVWWHNQRHHVSVGRFPNGKVGEIFIHGPKSGSDTDSLAYSIGTSLSIALQHGATVEELAKSVARGPRGGPACLVGAVLDCILGLKPEDGRYAG